MPNSGKTLLNRLIRTMLAVITISLLLGGLIAAGESGDGRILLYGAISATVLGISVSAGSSRQSETPL
jgi:hypothetical protein